MIQLSLLICPFRSKNHSAVQQYFFQLSSPKCHFTTLRNKNLPPQKQCLHFFGLNTYSKSNWHFLEKSAAGFAISLRKGLGHFCILPFHYLTDACSSSGICQSTEHWKCNFHFKIFQPSKAIHITTMPFYLFLHLSNISFNKDWER